jgi:HAD superfamily hydrolase (TIGR01662 family)
MTIGSHPSPSHPNLRFPVVLFDLGSTLIYFAGDWPTINLQGIGVLAQTLLQGGLKLDQAVFEQQFKTRLDEYFTQRASEFIEYTTIYILRGLLAEWGYTDPPQALVQQSLEAMYQVSEACWQLEPESLPALEQLRQQGYHLGLISNAADDADVQRLVDQFGLRSYFDIILTSAAQGIRKPNPHLFHTALRTWQVSPSQAVMVGDTLGADVLGARNAGLFSVWVTRRAAAPDNQSHLDTIQPDAVIENVGELPDLLLSMQTSGEH